MICPIHIRSRGLSLLLDYERFLEYHDGGALAGASIGWRAMEQASVMLSDEQIWNRADLTVSARHDGPGVRDALEYVTRCFSRNRFTAMDSSTPGGSCESAIDFYFTVSDGCRIAQIELREGLVPESFFEAVRHASAVPDSVFAELRLSEQKAAVADRVMRAARDQLFRSSVTELVPKKRGRSNA